jgi:hypothetical protein
VTDLDKITAELEEARRYTMLVMSACCEFVRIAAADGDDRARGLAFLLDDAHRRNAVAMFEAQFALPSAPLLDRSSRAGEDRGS